jgi:thiazole/oxazole-forming peptide maturase SagC family component
VLLLAFGVRVLLGAGSEVRLRTGVWNYEEAVIDFAAESAPFAGHLTAALGAMAGGTAYDPEDDPGLAALTPLEQAAARQLMSDLQQAGLVVTADDRDVRQRVVARLMGNARLAAESGSGGAGGSRVAVVADDPAVAAELRRLLDLFGSAPSMVASGVVDELRSADLTTNIDSFEIEEHIERLAAELGTGVVAVCLSQPAIPLLRNLNRVMLHNGQPAVVGFPDGPFVSLLGYQAPYTGCFECFEQRSLARLEDHVNYHEFVRAGLGRAAGAADGVTPLLHVLASLTATEAHLWAATDTSRFSGRLLNVFLPTFEIQTQDVLRMPSCPACGVVAQQKLHEVNFSTRAAIDSVVSRILR